MSELDDFMNEGLTISGEVMGEQSFTIDSRPLNCVLNEFEGEQEIELGGLLGTYNATLICTRAQFRVFGSPLTRTLNKKIVEIDCMRYSIKRIANDSVSVSLGLTHLKHGDWYFLYWWCYVPKIGTHNATALTGRDQLPNEG